MKTKKCRICGIEKIFEYFRVAHVNKDGLRTECKECSKIYDTEYRKRITKEQRQKWDKKYRAVKREAITKKQKEFRKKFPEKKKAWNIINKAIARGIVVREPCEICGSTISDAHHDDYLKPYKIRWFCRIHHKQIHAKAALREVDGGMALDSVAKNDMII